MVAKAFLFTRQRPMVGSLNQTVVVEDDLGGFFVICMTTRRSDKTLGGLQMIRIRHMRLCVSLSFVATALVVAGTTSAQADDGPAPDATVTSAEALSALSSTVGVLADSDSVKASSDADSAAVTSVDGTVVDVPKVAADGVDISAGGTSLTITPPNASASGTGQSIAPGVVAYPSNDGAATAVQSDETGSVRMMTVIAGSDSPTSYSYAVNVPAGGQLQLVDGGGAQVTDATGAYVAGFAPPWAKDAAQQSVATHYEVSGNSLVQVVDLASPTIQFPVVADPWIGLKLIDHVSWVNVSKWSPTLSVYPTWWGRYGAGAAARWAAWDEVKKLGGSRANTSSMETQFMCHFDAVRYRAPNKPSWNLDSARPNASELTYINYGCNYPDGPKEW